MARGDHYQHMATECLRSAQEATDPKNKALLLEMAQTWVKLAEQARESKIEGAPPDEPDDRE
jgi:hypothetical protein